MAATRANPEKLLTIIEEACQAKTVLPEFQRSFLWARTDIEELLESLLEEFFIGTFLIIDTPSDKPMFPFRKVEGLETIDSNASPSNHSNVRLVLDGQQRITSLFYALYAPEIPLSTTVYPYRFFLRLDYALQDAIEDAAVGISTHDRRRMSEMQSLIEESKAIPFTMLRHPNTLYRWVYKEQKQWTGEITDQLADMLRRFTEFQVPIVTLPQETPKVSVVGIFERINRTGVHLSLFDLAVARLYLKDVKLRDMWEVFERDHSEVASVVKPDSLLKVIAVFSGKEPRKSNLLDVIDELDKIEFERKWNLAVEHIKAAYERLKLHYGAFDQRWIPYSTMLVPLAVMHKDIKEEKGVESDYRKLDEWYWGSVFSQRYDSTVDSVTFADVRAMRNYLQSGDIPPWTGIRVEDIDFEIEERRSAIYRGAMCLIAAKKAQDFLTGQAADLNNCEDEHIFPKSVFGSKFPVNSILNRTLMSDATNRIKSDKPPSLFIKDCFKAHNRDERRLQATMRSHLIYSEAYEALKQDDFETFRKSRQKEFEKLIKKKLKGK